MRVKLAWPESGGGRAVVPRSRKAQLRFVRMLSVEDADVRVVPFHSSTLISAGEPGREHTKEVGRSCSCNLTCLRSCQQPAAAGYRRLRAARPRQWPPLLEQEKIRASLTFPAFSMVTAGGILLLT